MAATSVVLSHAARHIDKILHAPGLIRAFQAGHAGVDLFFALSGFIILHVHRTDIGRPERLARYAGRRLNRVVPLYWVALAMTVILAAGRHGLPHLQRLLWSATLLPSFEEPVLGIAWTLQFEMVFYVVFALLIADLRAGLLVLVVWQGASALTASGLAAPHVPAALCGDYCLEFPMGMAAAWWLHRQRVARPRLLACLAALALVAVYMLESGGLLDGFGVGARFAYGVPACLLILGVASAERAGMLSVPEWLRQIGNASYSVYLFQFVFIGLTWQMLLAAHAERLAPRPVLFVLLAASALVGGIAMSRFVERPLLHLAQSYGRTKLPKRA